jgi:hypothetical protein
MVLPYMVATLSTIQIGISILSLTVRAQVREAGLRVWGLGFRKVKRVWNETVSADSFHL